MALASQGLGRRLSSMLGRQTLDIPDRLIVKPIDAWPGDAREGHMICNESHDLRSGVFKTWPERMHRFFWLRDLRTMGGEDARLCAKDMVMQWIHMYGSKAKNSDHALAWRTDIVGERISTWISHYDFIESCHSHHDETFYEAFFESLYLQSVYLSRKIPNGCHDLKLLKALKGLLYAGLAFEGHEMWIEKALDLLLIEVNKQILADGCHISRSPMQLMRALQILLDVKSALAAGDYPLPDKIQHAIDRMGPALRFFRYADKQLALMNGSQKGNVSLLDSILAQSGVRGKAMSRLPHGGYERVSQGRTLLMFDCGNPPEWPHDYMTHAAPLSFELAYGKDRIFTSCGSHPKSREWSESLRATAAHNTVCLDHRNAYEIRQDGHFARKALAVSHSRHETGDAVMLQGSHDGYLPMNGVIHTRSLYLGDNGCDLRGEDILCAKITPAKPIEVAVRFHIHPRVLVSLVQEGRSALLRLPGGAGWRFQISAGILALEDSIYIGEGFEPRKSKQLVIYGQATDKKSKINWAFQREGI